MVKMTKEIMDTIAKQNPVPVATSSANGIPNVALVGFLKVMDAETILISDNFFLKTEDNLKHNPKVAFVVYDSYTRKCFQIKGSVKMITDGKIFDEMKQWVDSAKPNMPKKAAVVVHVEEVYDSLPGPHAGAQIL
jgi:predicted pyridoxine 5'-phosphate oxidase superfamily flavin-nucleotide-binding protein